MVFAGPSHWGTNEDGARSSTKYGVPKEENEAMLAGYMDLSNHMSRSGPRREGVPFYLHTFLMRGNSFIGHTKK
jgi:hypothetical protein